MSQSKLPPKEFDLIESIQILAVNSRENPDENAFLRKMQRWYSTTFYTPLIDVEKLPVPYILMHRYEHAIDNMSPEQYATFKNKVINKEALIIQEEDDDVWMTAEIERLNKVISAQPTKEEAAKVADKIEEETKQEVKEDFGLFFNNFNK